MLTCRWVAAFLTAVVIIVGSFHIKPTFPINMPKKKKKFTCTLFCIFICCSLRRTWGCREVQSEKERAAYEVIRNEHRRLGPMSYGEGSVLALFILMVALWFTRDPRFMDGWATHIFNAKAEWVPKNSIRVYVVVRERSIETKVSPQFKPSTRSTITVILQVHDIWLQI